MTLAVETRSLSRSFGALLAVDQLQLAVPKGSVFGFLGPNGAGKTTTIRMLLGLIKPCSGQVLLNGRDLGAQRCRALAGVGALVESPALFPNLTGRESLKLACLELGKPLAPIPGLLQLVDLKAAADRQVNQYSLGMRQRLALARALIGDPELLILDEPTNGLDPAGIADMRALIRELPERYGATVLLSSHLLTEIEQTADHCVVLNAGRALFQGSLDRLMARAQPSLLIETDQVEETRAFFECQGIAASNRNGMLHAMTSPNRTERAALLIRLISEGISVSQLRVEKPSLESLFIELTGGKKDKQ
jgi:ABC-2 type transport system ATP-binding protein